MSIAPPFAPFPPAAIPPTEPVGKPVYGACKECDHITFHALVGQPAPGTLAKVALALVCTNCSAQINLQGPE